MYIWVAFNDLQPSYKCPKQSGRWQENGKCSFYCTGEGKTDCSEVDAIMTEMSWLVDCLWAPGIFDLNFPL